MGEALAFGSLLAEGVRVRLSGQDSRRGTFSHRHSVLPTTRMAPSTRRWPTWRKSSEDEQGAFEVRDSPLSEAGVLGFDYGYSLDMPEG
jgi:2-oxoglutarate dehydrogenase E1 component